MPTILNHDSRPEIPGERLVVHLDYGRWILDSERRDVEASLENLFLPIFGNELQRLQSSVVQAAINLGMGGDRVNRPLILADSFIDRQLVVAPTLILLDIESGSLIKRLMPAIGFFLTSAVGGVIGNATYDFIRAVGVETSGAQASTVDKLRAVCTQVDITQLDENQLRNLHVMCKSIAKAPTQSKVIVRVEHQGKITSEMKLDGHHALERLPALEEAINAGFRSPPSPDPNDQGPGRGGP